MAEFTTSQALLCGLKAAKVSRIYGLISSTTPFHRFLAEAGPDIRYIHAHHEVVATAMADAEGRLTGRPGILLLGAGSGVLNGAPGLSATAKDCSPLLAIVGAVKQPLDQAATHSSCVKAFFHISRPAEAGEMFRRAWQAAATAPPGPVVLEVPEDLWEQGEETACTTSAADFQAPAAKPPADVESIAEPLRTADRPLLLAGGGLQAAAPAVLRLVESARFPVITTGNGRGVIPEDHLLCFGRAGYGGGSGAADYALSAADYVLCLGCGLSDLVTYDYTRLPKGRLAFINADGAYLRRLRERFPEAAVFEGDAPAALEALLQTGLKGLCRDAWWQCLEAARIRWQSVVRQCAFPFEPLLATYVLWRIAPMLPRSTIVTCGAGPHLFSVNAALPCYGARQYLSSCNSAATGFAFGAAMAARLIFPSRRVVCAIGHSDLLINLPDLETAVREDAMPLTLLLNDRASPDFLALAAAQGIRGARAVHPGEVDTICRRGLDAGGPQLLEFVISADEQAPANWPAIAGMKAAGAP